MPRPRLVSPPRRIDSSLLLVSVLPLLLLLLAQGRVPLPRLFSAASSVETELLHPGLAHFSEAWPNARLGAATWRIAAQQGALAMFGGAGTYTDEEHSFEETLNLADFWIFHRDAGAGGGDDYVGGGEGADALFPTTVAVANSDDGGAPAAMRWTIVDELGQDDPLANATSDPPLDASKPPGRTGAMAWSTVRVLRDGRFVQQFWLFGGKGSALAGQEGLLSDLWKLTVPIVNETTDLAAVFHALRWERVPGGTDGTDAAAYGVYTADAPAPAAATASARADPAEAAAGEKGAVAEGGAAARVLWPGARQSGATWTHDGNLWFLGGLGFGAAPAPGGTDFAGHYGLLNDLWEFEVSSLRWRWRGGADLPQAYGTYLTTDPVAVPLMPGARWKGAVWTNPASYELWLFGGYGFAETGGGAGYLDDLWKMSLSTLEWRWMGGRDSRPNEAGSYSGGRQWPGGRAGGVALSVPRCTSDVVFFLHGGFGYGEYIVEQGRLEDSWLYNVSGASWTFVEGSKVPNVRTVLPSAAAAGTSSSSSSSPASSSASSSSSTAATATTTLASAALGGRAYAAAWVFAPVDAAACVAEGGEIGAMSVLVFGGGGYATNCPAGASAEFQNDLWLLTVDVTRPDVVAIALGTLAAAGAAVGALIVCYCYCCRRRCRCQGGGGGGGTGAGVGGKAKRGCLCCRYRDYARVGPGFDDL